MPDYKRSKIYTIRCKTDDSLIYVGSTVETLSSRLSKHKFDFKLKPQIILYSHVQDWNDWYIELYEDFPCERKEQLLQREGQVIREIGTLNKKIQGRSHEETCKAYREENKEKEKLRHQKYYHENINKIKEYYLTNRDKLNEQKKSHYHENKEEINSKKREEKITCECGSIVRKDGLQEHKQSKKHQEYITVNHTQESH
jgi:hypothetical protein